MHSVPKHCALTFFILTEKINFFKNIFINILTNRVKYGNIYERFEKQLSADTKYHHDAGVVQW